MSNVDPHVPVIEKMFKELQAQNKALLSMNKSLIKDISNKLTAIDSRVVILEQNDRFQNNKFDWSIYFRDRVLPQVLTVLTLAILALAFAPK